MQTVSFCRLRKEGKSDIIKRKKIPFCQFQSGGKRYDEKSMAGKKLFRTGSGNCHRSNCGNGCTLCAKSVRVLFKMDKALSIYIWQNDPRRQKKQDEDEEIVGI